MMSDDDDNDFTPVNRSARNLASLFQSGEPSAGPAAASSTAAYVPPKQPKKDSPPKVVVASVVQAFSFGADQKWAPRGKIGVALLSTDNSIFQLILYLSKTQHITSARIQTSSVLTSQANNYLSFQDDGGLNWSIMFETKQAIVDFALQIVLAKAYLFQFKYDSITQDIREGEGSVLGDQDSVEVILHTYKLTETGTLSLASSDTGENKPIRFKIGKQQNGKTFDDTLRGMKKNGHRLTMIGTVLYNIEVTRVKREKEGRSGSITGPPEEVAPIERKRTITEDNEVNSEKNKMMQRINKMGGVSMLSNTTASSAFTAPTLVTSLSDDDSINNETISQVIPSRLIPTPAAALPPPVQFAQAAYHHPYPSIPQPTIYSPHQQQPMHDYHSRPGSSMGGMGYSQMPIWSPGPYPQPSPNVPSADGFYASAQQQHYPSDVRQLFHRLTEKVDLLTDKIDTKNNPSYPSMETSILLANIQRIVKENDTMKKDLFERSGKVEELNLKISDLLDRNQKLIEQSHQTAEQRNVVVNNVSEQTAQKILDLEKQKVELTNSLSLSTSRISDLQLQNNQYTQEINEHQSRLSTLLHKCEQAKVDLQRSENQRTEVQMKLESMQDELKNEKLTKKQLQINFNALEEELAEVKITSSTVEKTNNERKSKQGNERKRWQDEMDEQKQGYEKDLEELRTKLRKQRTTDSLTTNQEMTRIEQDLEQQWQEKLDRQQALHERVLTAKVNELEEMKTAFKENEIKRQEIADELNETKQELAAYKERCDKLQERLVIIKDKLIEITDEQPQLINDQVKQVINIIFQRLKSRIRPGKTYTGEEFLSRSLDIIKKATLKVLSNSDDAEEEQESSTDDQSDGDQRLSATQAETKDNDQPINGNAIDEKTLTEEVSAIPQDSSEEIVGTETSVAPLSNVRNGWDTVDDLPEQSDAPNEPSQVVLVTQDIAPSSNDVDESSVTTTATVEEEHQSDTSEDTIERPEIEPSVIPSTDTPIDEDSDNDLFQSARPSIQEVTVPPSQIPSVSPARYAFNENIPLMSNPDDGSDDEIFK